jgi:hypothetical protein
MMNYMDGNQKKHSENGLLLILMEEIIKYNNTFN